MTYDMQILGFNASGATGTFTVADAEARAQLEKKLDATALPEAIDTALAQAKASGEFDGADGESPTVAVSAITGGHRISITDINGTKTVDVLDGAKGDAGRGITSVARTSGNGAAGTTDTYTITYTDGSKSTFTVSNGKDGTTYTPSVDASGNLSWTNNGGLGNPVTVNIKGAPGSDATVTYQSIQTALGYAPADAANVVQRQQGSANVGKILAVGSDGNIVLVDMPEASAGDVTGFVDESNNIVLTGDLADGTYTLKYLKTDGTYIDAGELVVSSIATYAIACNLTNCTASGADSIRDGGTETITVTANDGYKLPDSISVSGAAYTWDSTSGQIVLSNPTGDVTITVVAVALPKYTNLADPTSSDWLANTRFGSDGGTRSYPDAACMNYVAVSKGDVVRVHGMDVSCGTVPTYVNMYKADGTIAWAYALNAGVGTGSQFSAVEVSTTEATVTCANTEITHLRFSGILNGAAEDVIVTVNEPIE